MALKNIAWQNSTTKKPIPSDRISQLYPCVDETETPLPRSWSSREKCPSISLSLNNLRVHYKGNAKLNKDAAAVRATHSIPPACGIYYYEVKIISKGKDGYIGIGLSVHNASLNRLPGWEKYTFGYHGDDGHSFNSQSHGDPYGPTFTTGDIIGCGINFVHNTCFYTKNGRNLGTVFYELPRDLYPTVGMQSSGETVDTNFGQEPFVYDITDEIQEARMKVAQTILCTPVANEGSAMQAMLHKIIVDYLVHHGYSSTAESFARISGQTYKEDTASIENRQNIQVLIMNGKISEAISLTEKLYPTVLSRKPWLHVRLLVRQFIESINDSDTVLPCSLNDHRNESVLSQNGCLDPIDTDDSLMEVDESKSYEMNGNAEADFHDHMNGVASSSNQMQEGESLDKPVHDPKREKFERLIAFGKKLKAMHDRLVQDGPRDDMVDKNLLRNAFSLLAYQDPRSSPLGYLLNRSERESIYSALNSAILEAQGMPKIPALEVIVDHAKESLKKMAKAGIGACAFTSVDKTLEY